MMLSKMEELRESLTNSGKLEELIQQFEELKQDEDLEKMFNLIWELEEGHKYLQIVINKSHHKSDTNAAKFRKIGNEYYQKKDLASSLNNYNLSIMVAPHPELSEKDHGVDCKTYNELYCGYNDRSVVLMDLKQYERAICDIDNAMKLNNTELIIHNYDLLERKVRCLIANNNIQEANNILDKLILEIELIDKVDAEFEITTKNIHNLKEKCNQLYKSNLEQNQPPKSDHMKSNKHMIQSVMNSSDLLFAYTDPVPPEIDANPSIPSFSKALKLCYSSEKGRFVVAERDILPGEVVAVEEAYTYTTNSNDITKQKSFCCTCMRRCDAPLPCPQCSMITFCSETCRMKGWNNFHKKECQILSTISSLGFPATDNLIKALRIILKTDYLDLKTIMHEIKNRNIITSPLNKGFNKNGIYDSFDYETVYNLVGNAKERDPELLIVLCYWVFMVIKVLIQSEQYYVDRAGIPFIPNNEDIVLVGSCILRHIMSIYCNCFSVNETKINVKERSIKAENIGNGLYPTLSLFNHSCNPSVMNFTYGNVGVIHAFRFIPAGEEVTTKYGKQFCFDKDVEARRTHLLKSYFFICNCEACINDWQPDSNKPPELKPHMERIYRISDHVQNYDDFTETSNDLELELEDELEDMFQLEYDTEQDLESLNVDFNEHIPNLCKIIEFLERFAIKPNIVNIRAQLNLVKCIRNKRPCYYFKRNI